MRRLACDLLFGWLFLASSMPARGDGGSLRLSETTGGYRITAFTSPTPFRVGWVDISVLVQDAASGQAMLEAQVTVRMAQRGQPGLECQATTEAATNKLLHAAQFELSTPGRWEMEVEVDGSHGNAVVRCELEVAEHLPRWLEIWPWISWPALAIALFGIHQVLTRRLSHASPRRDPNASSKRG